MHFSHFMNQIARHSILLAASFQWRIMFCYTISTIIDDFILIFNDYEWQMHLSLSDHPPGFIKAAKMTNSVLLFIVPNNAMVSTNSKLIFHTEKFNWYYFQLTQNSNFTLQNHQCVTLHYNFTSNTSYILSLIADIYSATLGITFCCNCLV